MNKHLDAEITTIDVLTTAESNRLHELEAVVDQQKTNVEQAGLQTGYALREINEQRLYRSWRGTPEHPLKDPQKGATFAEYVEGRHQWTRTTAYRLINWANITDQLSPEGYKPTKAEARVLEVLEPEQIQMVAKVVQASTGSDKPTTTQIKAVAEVIEQLDASGTVEDPETGQHVKFTDLPEEKRVAIIRENVTTSTHERMERQKAHIDERQQQKAAEQETLSSLAAKTWQEWLETWVLNNPHMKIFMELLAVEGRAQYQFKAMNEETRQVLYVGDPKPWMKAAAFALIEVLK